MLDCDWSLEWLGSLLSLGYCISGFWSCF